MAQGGGTDNWETKKTVPFCPPQIVDKPVNCCLAYQPPSSVILTTFLSCCHPEQAWRSAQLFQINRLPGAIVPQQYSASKDLTLQRCRKVVQKILRLPPVAQDDIPLGCGGTCYKQQFTVHPNLCDRLRSRFFSEPAPFDLFCHSIRVIVRPSFIPRRKAKYRFPSSSSASPMDRCSKVVRSFQSNPNRNIISSTTPKA